jgi:methionyl-tRNA formyltransferase
MQLRASTIKEFCQGKNLKILQPPNINLDLKCLQNYNPDIIVVAAYGQILSNEFLGIPRIGTINIHASLLPKYRGAAPIQWALINGESETGITTFFINQGLDTGDILVNRSMPITDEHTTASLEMELATLSADVMMETLGGLEAGTLTGVPQDHDAATLAPKIKKELALIDWTKGAREVFNLIRGLNPNPGAFTFFNGKRLKVHRSESYSAVDNTSAPGEVIEIRESGPVISTGQGKLLLAEVQPEGKKMLAGGEFARGYQIKIGERLGINSD